MYIPKANFVGRSSRNLRAWFEMKRRLTVRLAFAALILFGAGSGVLMGAAPEGEGESVPVSDTVGATKDATPLAEGFNHFIADLNLELVWINAGSFLMGSPPDERRNKAEGPQVQVTLSKGFWLG